MEEILASIRRIISEDEPAAEAAGRAGAGARARCRRRSPRRNRSVRPNEDDVLELTQLAAGARNRRRWRPTATSRSIRPPRRPPPAGPRPTPAAAPPRSSMTSRLMSAVQRRQRRLRLRPAGPDRGHARAGPAVGRRGARTAAPAAQGLARRDTCRPSSRPRCDEEVERIARRRLGVIAPVPSPLAGEGGPKPPDEGPRRPVLSGCLHTAVG